MARTHGQLEAERRKRLEERRRILMEFPEVYQRDFDRAIQKYLRRIYPEVDSDDCDVLFKPVYREHFCTQWPEEARELSRKYNIVPVWDPDGDESPEPVDENPARIIRTQEDRIWAKQLTPDSIINLSPHKMFGRFVLVEIDLSKPRREIEASVMAIVDQKRKRLKISHTHRELVKPPEPRDRDSSYTFKKMEVWQMVEELREQGQTDIKKILTSLAEKICRDQGWDSSYGDFKDDPDAEEKMTKTRKALKNAYERDKRLYFGQ